VEVIDHEQCNCEMCQRVNDLVAEVGEVVDGHSVKDIMLAFSSILSNIGESLPVSNREFAAGFYTSLVNMMEDDTDGDCTYN
jgi:hypothetical protein